MPTRRLEEVPDPPTVLCGRYELLSLLGRGGMSEVHLGRDLELGRRVAVKLLPRDAGPAGSEGSAGDVERLRDEARAAAALNHPGVVTVHDIGTTGTSVFIVMEYLEGESLAELLRRCGPMPPPAAARLGAEVCAALEAAHRAGVTHRDISPGNIMLRPDGTVAVTDFGIARMSGAALRTATGHIVGTPAFLSPEQGSGGSVDHRSDLYSLGCCLYAALTGRPPFRGPDAVSVVYQHMRDRPPPPRSLDPRIPPGLDALVMRALAKEPEHRHPTAAAMGAELLHCAGTAARPAPDPDRGESQAPAVLDDTLAEIEPGSDGTKRRVLGVTLIAAAVAIVLLAVVAAVLLG